MSTTSGAPEGSNRAAKKRRRWIALALLVLVVATAVVGKPSYLWIDAWLRDKPVVDAIPPGHVDDASRLNLARVAEIWIIPTDRAAAESQLRDLLIRAQAEGLQVAIAGARHSMGGHTIYPDGIVVNMLPFNHMYVDPDQRMLHVGAGARWSEVIPFLDSRGMSPAIMQSNNDFSIGGSLSVNCHGWQQNLPPIASTVESLRLMKADGAVVKCNREDNAELFSLVLGGYGLFGVILDVELYVVPNERYRADVEVRPSDQYITRFHEKVDGAADIGLVYGRLSVVPGEETFLREAILTVFRQASCPRDEIPTLQSQGFRSLRRQVYRAQIGSDAGKEVRWKAEKTFGEQMSNKYFSRNQLLDEGAELYQERNADRTDVLHEYFIPPDHVAAFLDHARRIIPKHGGDLLNVTVRNVKEDTDSFLRYADRDMFAFVMLFNQRCTPQADRLMEAMTQELIDAAIVCEGRYYLTYRLHATKEQLRRAYPQAIDFFELKRQYDPEEVFQNQFYMKYGAR